MTMHVCTPTNQETPEPTQEKLTVTTDNVAIGVKRMIDNINGTPTATPEQKDFVEGWEEEFEADLKMNFDVMFLEFPQFEEHIKYFIRKVEATAYAQGEQDMKTALRLEIEGEVIEQRKQAIHKWSESNVDQKAYVDGIEDTLSAIARIFAAKIKP